MEFETPTTIHAPSRRKLAKAAGIALLVALILLFTVILPAEYGYDPLRTGKALGLTGLSEAAAENSGSTPPAVSAGVFTPQSKLYKVDSQEFLLTPGTGMEMKYHMEKGASMVYSWKANDKLEFEFHGEPDQKPNKDYYDSYEIDKAGKEAAFGSFIAPSTGIHGWFWRNNTAKDVTFHLYVAGFFDSAKMYAGGPPEDMPVDDVK